MTNINIESLIYSVQEKFDGFADYENKPYGYFGYGGKGEKEYLSYERAVYHGNNYIYDICNVLNINRNNLYTIVRAIRKWNERHNWEICFPFQDNAERIMNYLQE